MCSLPQTPALAHTISISSSLCLLQALLLRVCLSQVPLSLTHLPFLKHSLKLSLSLSSSPPYKLTPSQALSVTLSPSSSRSLSLSLSFQARYPLNSLLLKHPIKNSLSISPSVSLSVSSSFFSVSQELFLSLKMFSSQSRSLHLSLKLPPEKSAEMLDSKFKSQLNAVLLL